MIKNAFRPFFLSAKGSRGTTMLPNGIAASLVSWDPNGILIRVRVFTAHPFASRIGAILRLRNFIEAKIIDGPEIHSKIPIRPSGTQKPKPNKACKILPINAEIPPNAVPINAIVPRSSFFEATGAQPYLPRLVCRRL